MIPADAAFLAAFEAGTLPCDEWTHAAHIRMAFLYLTAPGVTFAAALQRIRDGIHAYNAAQGNPNGHHETITAAFARRLRDWLHGNTEFALSFESFQAAHPDLLQSKLLLEYYSRSRLLSRNAQSGLVQPDIAPLPQSSFE